MTTQNKQQTQLLETALLEIADIDKVVRLEVFELADGTILVGAKVSLPADLTMRQVSVAVTLAERRIQRVLPQAKHVFITPDVFYDDSDVTSTSTIVTLSYD